MKIASAFLLAAVCITVVHSQQLAPLTVEKIMRDQRTWLGTSPSDIRWSADSKRIYFKWNPERNLGDSLYYYDRESKKTGKVAFGVERNLPSFEGSYNRTKSRKVYASNGDLFVQDIASGGVRQLTKTVDTELSPVFSLDEKSVLFLRAGNLYAIELESGLVTQWSDFKAGTKRDVPKPGEQESWLKKDQLAMFEVLKERKERRDLGKKIEEANKPEAPKEIFTGEKRVTGIRLSPDQKYITYQLYAQPKNAKSTIVPSYVTESGFTEDIPARTKVGAQSGTAEFWVYDIVRDTTRLLSTRQIPGISDKPDYLKDYPRQDTLWKKRIRDVSFQGPFWSEDGKIAVLTARSADNKDRWIFTLDPSSLTLRLLDRQRDEAWIGGPGVSGFGGGLGWIDNNTLYYQSEASGYSHLYRINVITGEKKQLTQGKFEVQGVQLSQDKKSFYLTTNEVHPGEQHFYKMSVEGGERLRLTTLSGASDVMLSPDEKYLAIRYSNSTTPWELYISENKAGITPQRVTSSTTEEFRSYPWREAKVVTIKARDGQDIYARVYEPRKSNGKAVIFVHGAGYLQNAHKWWSNYSREYMFHNLLTDQGYTVLDMDYRASAGYGRDWRTGIYRFMGGKDLTDNVDGAKWLIERYKINPKKIGIYGGSYGGFITLMAQFTTPGVFAAGAALRPVTDWAAYNQGYTANILNEPQSDSLAYRKSSPIYYAEGLKGKLLICHGMVDVNVHFQDVVRLSQRLIELKKENWELAVYPMEDHGFVEASSWTDEYKRIYKLFQEM